LFIGRNCTAAGENEIIFAGSFMSISKTKPCPETSQSFPAQYKSLEQVRQFVAHQAEKCGFDDKEIFGITMAVDEAFTNIINHAYMGECVEEVECTCFENEEGFTVRMIDSGSQFDPASIPAPDLESNLEDRAIGGLGVYFMRCYMDEVHFSVIPQPERGVTHNQLMMVKRRKTNHNP